MSRKPYVNGEYKSKSSKFSYPFIFVAITMTFLEVVTPPNIYQTDYISKQISVASLIPPSSGVLIIIFWIYLTDTCNNSLVTSFFSVWP